MPVYISLPCKANDLERTLHSVCDQGHWDTARVSLQDNKLVITINNTDTTEKEKQHGNA